MSMPAQLKSQLVKFPMFFLFLVSYVIVHLHFEYNFWSATGAIIFDKYAAASADQSAIAIAEQVYYAKAGWCFILIVLQAAGVRFYTALALSFFLYGLVLLFFFPVRIYALLNLLLAVGMLVEVVVRYRELGPLLVPPRKPG